MRYVEIAIGDPSAAELAEQFRRADIAARGAKSDVLDGIRKTLNVVRDTEGKVGLIIHPRCENFIQEMSEDYRMPEGSEKRVGQVKPAKKNDHGPDAIRYWTELRHGRWGR